MLILDIKGIELYDDSKQEFIYIEDQHIMLEHSLLSISEWESITHKPFLSDKEERTTDEIYLYLRCMTLNKKQVDERIYKYISNQDLKKIEEYIKDTMTATWFKDTKGNKTGETITSELIYYWMVAYNIPYKFERWHINRLLTLIRICSIKNDSKGPTKMGKQAIYSQNRALNEARKRARNTKG